MKPLIIATWPFGLPAVKLGYSMLAQYHSALDSVELAANLVEDDRLVLSVGSGSLPNADGVLELDAAIMDGKTHSAGSVAAVVNIARPISLARRVMETTPHVMLVGDNARRFALSEGWIDEDLRTPLSQERWLKWWSSSNTEAKVAHFDYPLTAENHDTIGICAIDEFGNLAAGCTTSGMAWKKPGRVGDSPIIGSGLYVDNEIGAAAATGDGDEMMKACLSYRAVMLMGSGSSPQEACEEALRYLLRKRPTSKNGYGAALICLNKDGEYGASATVSGFGPSSLWKYAVADHNEISGRIIEGPYVDLSGSIPSQLPQ